MDEGSSALTIFGKNEKESWQTDAMKRSDSIIFMLNATEAGLFRTHKKHFGSPENWYIAGNKGIHRILL